MFMYSFSKTSRERLNTCDPRLIAILEKAIKVVDFSVLEGTRGEIKQNYLFDIGLSKLRYPLGKHNRNPSMAVDIAPWPINWKDEKRFTYLAGIVKGIASANNVKIRWGGDWDSDNDFTDQNFHDLGHFEIIEG